MKLISDAAGGGHSIEQNYSLFFKQAKGNPILNQQLVSFYFLSEICSPDPIVE
jgi:hypothetical protein